MKDKNEIGKRTSLNINYTKSKNKNLKSPTLIFFALTETLYVVFGFKPKKQIDKIPNKSNECKFDYISTYLYICLDYQSMYLMIKRIKS